MFKFNNPSLNVIQSKIDLNKVGTINYDELGILIYYQIIDTTPAKFLLAVEFDPQKFIKYFNF